MNDTTHSYVCERHIMGPAVPGETQCNALLHTAPHCSTLQHTAACREESCQAHRNVCQSGTACSNVPQRVAACYVCCSAACYVCCIFTHAHSNSHTRILTFTNTHIHIHTHAHSHSHTHMFTFTHTHIHIHKHTHSHSHTPTFT